MCLASVFVACGSNAPLASTSPVAPTASEVPRVRTPAVAVSGVVVADGRPIDNAPVTAQWSCGTNGCSAARGSVTDAAGRYTIDGLPEGQPVWVTVEKDGFVQQCVATITTQQIGATLDLMLTSISNLSTARPLSGPGSRTVAGDVFEQTTTGRRFVDGASVKVYSDALYYAEPVAFTRSDAAGHYALCGLPEGRISSLIAEKPQYNFSMVSVEAGTDATIDIQLRR